MLSKLSRNAFIGLKNAQNLKHITVLNISQKNKIFPISSRYLSTDNDFNIPSNFFEVPTVPEPVSNVVLNTIGEPTFASLGLNNYTPSGLIQYILENAHIQLDLPWWACIITTSLFIKTLMVPVLINQRKGLIKLQSNIQRSSFILSDAIEARQSGDSLLMYEIIKKFDNIQQELTSSLKTAYMPILIQTPLFISAFLALKGMVNIPVPSLATGGLWWFTDLTLCDPYYILPLITTASIIAMVELGVEMPTEQGKQMKFIFRCIMPISFLFMSTCQSTLLLYWTCSNMYALVFSQILKLKKVQKALGFDELVNQPVFSNPKKFGIKEVMEVINSFNEVVAREKIEENRWKKQELMENLDRGMDAASIRKQVRERLKQHKNPTVDVVGEIIEDIKKKNKT